MMMGWQATRFILRTSFSLTEACLRLVLQRTRAMILRRFLAIGDAMGSLHDMPILSLGAGTQNHLLSHTDQQVRPNRVWEQGRWEQYIAWRLGNKNPSRSLVWLPRAPLTSVYQRISFGDSQQEGGGHQPKTRNKQTTAETDKQAEKQRK